MDPSPAPARAQAHHHETHDHTKNIKRGTERLDRRSATGVAGFPKKSGHGGKFTWDGPTHHEDYLEDDDGVVALDENDPNYIDPQQEEEDKKVAASVVEVAKIAAPADETTEPKQPVAN